jgi:N-methylhydantoinase A
VKLDWSIDLRYSRQVHEVTTAVRGRTPLDEPALTQLVSDFESQYERKYGKGSAFREAGMEMTMFRLTARGLFERPRLEPLPLADKDCSNAKIDRRPIFIDAKNGMAEANIYDFSKLSPGNIVNGPAVIHTPITTIVLQDRQRGTMDGYRNMLIDFDT